MTVLNRRVRMVSFRLSDKEYEEALGACASHGVRSVSTLARRAILGINRHSVPSESASLEAKLEVLVEKLSRTLTILHPLQAVNGQTTLHVSSAPSVTFCPSNNSVPSEDTFS